LGIFAALRLVLQSSTTFLHVVAKAEKYMLTGTGSEEKKPLN
jgi:hypothetical protein